MWLRCWGAGEQAWLRGGELRLLEVGDGHGRAWAVLGVHGVARGLRVRAPAGGFAALRGSREVRERGGTALGFHGVDTSVATVATMAHGARAAVPWRRTRHTVSLLDFFGSNGAVE